MPPFVATILSNFLALMISAMLLRSCSSWNLNDPKFLSTPAVIFDEVSREFTKNRRNRIYANTTKLSQLSGPVTRENLFTPYQFKTTVDSVWITAPYRFSVIASSWAIFPYLISGLRDTVPHLADNGGFLPSSITPAISLLYGAWLGLTFNILEERINTLQRTVTQESAMLRALCERTSLLTEGVPRQAVIPIYETLFKQTTTLAVLSRYIYPLYPYIPSIPSMPLYTLYSPSYTLSTVSSASLLFDTEQMSSF